MKLRLLPSLLLTLCALSSLTARVQAQRLPESAWQRSPTGKADAWVLFEQRSDNRRRRVERIFNPLSLGLLTAAGVVFAAVSDVPTGSRIAFGVAAGASAATLLPSALSVSQDRSRAWCVAGVAGFSVAAGVGIALVDAKAHAEDGDSLSQSGRWLGASVALQGLALLPLGFIPGFPGQQDYDLYWKLPVEARPAAAARILHQIDKFEQRAVAISLLSSVVSAIVLSVGVLTVDNRDARQEIATYSLLPLGSALGMIPRLFSGSRLERFAIGEAPRRLAFNAW